MKTDVLALEEEIWDRFLNITSLHVVKKMSIYIVLEIFLHFSFTFIKDCFKPTL